MKHLLLLSLLCLSMATYAQYDGDGLEDWTLPFDEEEEQKPQHHEFKNALWLQYSPSRYICSDGMKMGASEIALGYSRFVQVMEDTPLFVEVGANMKYGFPRGDWGRCLRALTFRIPINLTYKIYPWKDKDWAIAPYAGVNVRALALAKDCAGEKDFDLIADGDWKRFQVGWQTGIRFYVNRIFLGVSYSRDFPDSSHTPALQECGVHVGCCF